MSVLTLTLGTSNAAAQSATIRVAATVVQPPVRSAVLDTAVARAAQAVAREASRTELPGGVQVRRVGGSSEVREVRIEFVAN